MSRGRRDPESCVVGDVVDGWTVEAYDRDRRLRLAADLWMPGRGWLEFEVKPLADGRQSEIRQTATFDPRGVLGRAYWLAILPLHALIFRGLLRNVARRAEIGDAAPPISVFVHRSIVPIRAQDLFRWHERPDALLDLIPSLRWIRIEHRVGGLHNGGRVRFSIGIGALRVRWEARHFGYIRGRQFCDEQVRGPFSTWRHTHRIEGVGTDQSLYEDRVEFAVPGGRLVNRLAAPLLRPLLARAFAWRHQRVCDACLS